MRVLGSDRDGTELQRDEYNDRVKTADQTDQVNKRDKDEKDPPIRVVDRRWWARGETAAADEPSVAKPSYIEELEQKLHESGVKLQALLTEHRRSLEEFDQIKSRMRRDAAREVERGRRALLADFLDVVDNLERAIAAAREQTAAQPSAAVDQLTRGIELARDQFLSRLAAFGVTRTSALGQPFDAVRHEAVTTAPVERPDQDGIVVAVVKDGYTIGEELLRPASVVVGKHTA
jgi:molecular chaperone GrpE